MKTLRLLATISLSGALPLEAQQAEETVFRDNPLTWRIAFVQVAWEFDKGTDIVDVKNFNTAVEVSLATPDGYRGSVEAGGEGTPSIPRNPFVDLGLLQMQAAQGLVDHHYFHLSTEQRDSFYCCRNAFTKMPKTIRFSRLQLCLKVTVSNTTAADIILSGSGELPVFHEGKPVVIAKPKEPLNNITLVPGCTNGVDLVFLADLDATQATSLMSAVASGLHIDLVRAQIKALQNNRDLRLTMDVNSRRTYKFAIDFGGDDLIAWRVKKRAGVGGSELTVADILEKINAMGLRDDQGGPLLKIKDNRCVGIGTLPVIGKDYLLIADHGMNKTFFLWEWPLDTVIQGDVALRIANQKNRSYGAEVSPEIVQGVARYEAFTHDPFAQLILGHCSEYQVGVKKDANAAKQWYTKAAMQGSASGMFLLSGCYLKDGADKDEDTAVSWLRRAAEQGDPDAQYQLGYCYERGAYVKQDDHEAVKWYRKAVEQGELRSQYRLGRCYDRAIGVAKDKREAAKWYRMAADQGHGDAQNSFGYCLQRGFGIEKDELKARSWFLKSAFRGFVTGMYNLGYSYEYGLGVEKNEREAARWYLRSAKRGETYAMNSLGRLYLKGLGIEKNEREAVKLFRQTAEQGSSNGQNSLGYCYRNGFGVEKNGVEAVKWLRLSISNGGDMAHKTLGLCYLEGFGVEKNEEEGVRLLRKAVEMGITSAQDELKKIGK